MVKTILVAGVFLLALKGVDMGFDAFNYPWFVGEDVLAILSILAVTGVSAYAIARIIMYHPKKKEESCSGSGTASS